MRRGGIAAHFEHDFLPRPDEHRTCIFKLRGLHALVGCPFPSRESLTQRDGPTLEQVIDVDAAVTDWKNSAIYPALNQNPGHLTPVPESHYASEVDMRNLDNRAYEWFLSRVYRATGLVQSRVGDRDLISLFSENDFGPWGVGAQVIFRMGVYQKATPEQQKAIRECYYRSPFMELSWRGDCVRVVLRDLDSLYHKDEEKCILQYRRRACSDWYGFYSLVCDCASALEAEAGPFTVKWIVDAVLHLWSVAGIRSTALCRAYKQLAEWGADHYNIFRSLGAQPLMPEPPFEAFFTSPKEFKHDPLFKFGVKAPDLRGKLWSPKRTGEYQAILMATAYIPERDVGRFVNHLENDQTGVLNYHFGRVYSRWKPLESYDGRNALEKAVQFYLDRKKQARDGCVTWILCARRLGVNKDVVGIIKRLLWEERDRWSP